ncbi:hypothetical protein VP01_774g1 [Puccinia sorghi]|uniref:Uncharacterized protein n=1 Tax=Puccinia sorghi TaxID=27349 RepID=A0A0L6UBD4_9BASI|nr:hypothetical protein VP01_774g1 [Puccinia sorghi]
MHSILAGPYKIALQIKVLRKIEEEGRDSQREEPDWLKMKLEKEGKPDIELECFKKLKNKFNSWLCFSPQKSKLIKNLNKDIIVIIKRGKTFYLVLSCFLSFSTDSIDTHFVIKTYGSIWVVSTLLFGADTNSKINFCWKNQSGLGHFALLGLDIHPPPCLGCRCSSSPISGTWMFIKTHLLGLAPHQNPFLAYGWSLRAKLGADSSRGPSEGFCCYSNHSPKVIQPSFDAQSLCRLHSDCTKTSNYANMWSLDGSLAGACCMSTAGNHHLWLSQPDQVLGSYFISLFLNPSIPLVGLEGVYLLPHTPSLVFGVSGVWTEPLFVEFIHNRGWQRVVSAFTISYKELVTHTRAWKANQISASHSSFFPPWKMSHSHCHAPPILSSNLPRLLWNLVTIMYGHILCTKSQHALHNQTDSFTWIFLKACDCIIAKGFSKLQPGYKGFVVELRISTEKSPPNIRLKLCTTYNQHTTGFDKLDQLHAVDMQHVPAKLQFKLHMFAFAEFLAQSLCIKDWLNHSGREMGVTPKALLEFLHFKFYCTVTVPKHLYMQTVEQVFFAVSNRKNLPLEIKVRGKEKTCFENFRLNYDKLYKNEFNNRGYQILPNLPLGGIKYDQIHDYLIHRFQKKPHFQKLLIKFSNIYLISPICINLRFK